MKVTAAQPRDFTKILGMAEGLFRHLREVDTVGSLSDDEDIVSGTLMTQLVYMSTAQDNIVLVMKDDRGGVRGFLCGRIEALAKYHTHSRVAAVLTLYPQSREARPLLEMFDQWGRACGCTARIAYVGYYNDMGIDALIEDGMISTALILSLPYDKDSTLLEDTEGAEIPELPEEMPSAASAIN